jgi:hypothetical protein
MGGNLQFAVLDADALGAHGIFLKGETRILRFLET